MTIPEPPSQPGYPCEVCGHVATEVVTDLAEGAAEIDINGRSWRVWHADGTHYFCSAHKRAQKHTTREAK